jgi:hypothetical protein
MSGQEKYNSPDNGGLSDGQHPGRDSTTVSALKRVPAVVNQRRPMRIPPRNQNHKTPMAEGAPDATD